MALSPPQTKWNVGGPEEQYLLILFYIAHLDEGKQCLGKSLMQYNVKLVEVLLQKILNL
jgi:hypothetical protein